MSAQKSPAHKIRPPRKNLIDDRLGDEARFIRSWLENPRLAGAITPSGRFLARAMAQCVDPADDGPIVELGPGTGPVTQALLARGISPERLLLVEFEPSFCHLLAHKFPRVKVIRGDAYRLSETLAGQLGGRRPAAVVSSLPLLTKPETARIALLRQAFDLMGPEGRFIQFTYGVKSPVSAHVGGAAFPDPGAGADLAQPSASAHLRLSARRLPAQDRAADGHDRQTGAALDPFRPRNP